jgi:hypothetical protein
MRLSRVTMLGIGVAVLAAGLGQEATAAVFKTYIPGVTMVQMKVSSVDCAVDWPEQQFGLVYQGCHQLYGQIDFDRGAKTLRRLTLVGRDLANPDNIVARIMRKRIDQPNGTFNNPEVVAEVSTSGPVDALQKISVNVPAALGRLNLEAYFYYVEVSMTGPVEFAGVTVEYSN